MGMLLATWRKKKKSSAGKREAAAAAAGPETPSSSGNAVSSARSCCIGKAENTLPSQNHHMAPTGGSTAAAVCATINAAVAVGNNNSASPLNVNEEYRRAVRTKSYTDIWAKVHHHIHRHRTHGHHQEDDDRRSPRMTRCHSTPITPATTSSTAHGHHQGFYIQQFNDAYQSSIKGASSRNRHQCYSRTSSTASTPSNADAVTPSSSSSKQQQWRANKPPKHEEERYHDATNGSMAIVPSDTATPLMSSFDEQIRPLLDAVDRQRQLKMTKEGIELPTIVVVGDQSSGKSSVLESLAGISLPRGQGICTRVPLIMRLQNQLASSDDGDSGEQLVLEYLQKRVCTTEDSITDAIRAATDEIAGDGKGISNTPSPSSLQVSSRRAVHTLIEKMKKRSTEHVKELSRMEALADYTSNPDYVKTWTALMEQQEEFMLAVQDHTRPTKIHLKLFGDVDVGHLRVNPAMAEQAFDMTMRLNAYWRSVILRLVDGLGLHVVAAVHSLVENELEKETVEALVGGGGNGIERILQETPASARKRERLKESIQLLRESKDVIANIMDRIVTYGDEP